MLSAPRSRLPLAAPSCQPRFEHGPLNFLSDSTAVPKGLFPCSADAETITGDLITAATIDNAAQVSNYEPRAEPECVAG